MYFEDDNKTAWLEDPGLEYVATTGKLRADCFFHVINGSNPAYIMSTEYRYRNADGSWSNWIHWLDMEAAAWQCGDYWGGPVHWEKPVPAASAYELRFFCGSRSSKCKTQRRDLGWASTVPPIAAPTNLEVTSVTGSSISLAWQDNANNENEFELQRSEDAGQNWNLLATPAANSTSYTDAFVTAATTYRYRIRATNDLSESGWSNEVEATAGCPSDTDCDGLSNSDEATAIGTDPLNPDTDGDGLLDPWEVEDASINGDGFSLPQFPNSTISSTQVFGPFTNPSTTCTTLSDGRLPPTEPCLNAPPDPLHKDVFLELDWQDCRHGHCPHGDELHHAPDLAGLQLVIDAFTNAPVTNPDGTDGINLRILIDESVVHEPNCDQGESEVRQQHFGTEVQRGVSEIIAAKELAVRYVWSGHSSFSDDDSQCPSPGFAAFAQTGFGARAIEDYDWSPFGDANVGGRDVLITLGPVWSCPTERKVLGFVTPCYRSYLGGPNPATGEPEYQATLPGVFPTRVSDGTSNEVDLPYPVIRLLGLPEEEGITQLWSRTLMHLLGHSLGLSNDTDVRNVPDVPASDSNGDGINEAKPPDTFSTWSGLQYAPDGLGTPTQEVVPRYSFLASQDLDGDAVIEGSDNCPGVPNPEADWGFPYMMHGQPDTDFDRVGDACDPDADGDGQPEGLLAPGKRHGGPLENQGLDPFPFDTDNDGVTNEFDPDDDGDMAPDLFDNCVVTPNKRQLDMDGDGFGDRCDGDIDGDGVPNLLEEQLGRDPLSPDNSLQRPIRGGGFPWPRAS